jgi:hypothetical protein
MTTRTTVTRKHALEKAAEMLEKAQGPVAGEAAVGKYLSCAQLYLALAHEINSDPISSKTEA